MSDNSETKDSSQNLSARLAAGDKASLEQDFAQAIKLYEEALKFLDEQKTFDYEKTRDCLNKLISVYSHLESFEKIEKLSQRLNQIEATQSVIKLQASAVFFAGRNQPDKAASAYAKALQIAKNNRPLNAPLINELKRAYEEQKSLVPEDSSSAVASAADDADNTGVQKSRVMRGVGTLSEERKAANPLAILDIAKAPIFLLIVSMVILASAGQLFVSADVRTDSKNNQLQTNFAGLHFNTCDQQKTLSFKDEHSCVMHSSTGDKVVRYTVLNDWIKNTPMLFKGFLRKKEYWFKAQDEELIDRDNVIFYQPTAPEKTIIGRMWFYARCAQDQFKEHKSYPSSLDRSKRTYQDFNYTNPFTGKTDCASLLAQGMQNNVIDLKSRGLSDRQWRPGAILCLQQDTKHFMVQGFDGQGKPFVSSDPTHYFVIELEYGKILTPEPTNAKKADKQILSAKNISEDNSATIYITDDERVEGFVEAARRLPQIIWWTAFTVALGCFSFARRFKDPQRIKKISKYTIYASVIALILFYAGAW